MLLDEKLGYTNTIDKDRMLKLLPNVFDVVKEVLLGRCGPTSRYVMITDTSDRVTPPEFTKDGINIVRHLTFGSGIENILKDIVVAVGSAIEKKAADGTTSSMLIAMEVLRYLLSELDLTDLSDMEVRTAYNEFANDISNMLDTRTIDDIAPKDIAYMQAYTSSHGDEELASIMSEFISMVPQKAWSNISFSRSKYETDKRFSIVKVDSFYHADATIMSTDMLNKSNGTAMEYIEPETIYTPSINTDSVGYGHLKKHMDDIAAGIETTDKVFIIPSQSTGVNVVNEVYTFCSKYENNKLAIIGIDAFGNFNEFITLGKLLDNNRTPVDEQYRCHGISKVTFADGVFHIFTHDQETTPERTLSTSTQEYVDELLKTISELRENKTTSDRTKAKEYDKVVNKIIMNGCVSLYMGGTIFENVAAVSVVDDVIGATQKALRNGITLGASASLEKALIEYKASSYVTKLFKLAFLHGISVMREGLYRGTTIESTEPINVTTREPISFDTDIPVVQPKTTDTELLKRIGDAIIRYVLADRIIVSGGLFSKQRKELRYAEHK